MTNLTDHVVSLPLAQRLCELGVKQSSQFCWLQGVNTDEYFLYPNDPIFPNTGWRNKKPTHSDGYSAFLASELGNAIFEVVRTARDNDLTARDNDLDILEDERIRAVNESNYFELKNEVEVRGEFIVFIIENNLASEEWKAKWMEAANA